MKRWARVGWVCVLAAATAGCPDSARRPEPPAIARDVAMVGPTDFAHPHIPPLRTTVDGRVGIAVEAGGIELRLYLLAPEKLAGPVMPGPAGARILADTNPFAGGIPFRPAPGKYIEHHTLCEVRREFLDPADRGNPYACGPGDAHDCYDVTHIGFTNSTTEKMRLWGTPMTIEVADPKTAAAQIVDVRIGETAGGPEVLTVGSSWNEPMVTWDGRLLTGRRLATDSGLLDLFLDWTNPNTGESFSELYDIMYALMPDEAAPCDVTAWTDFHPISHAPYDPRMVGRYGLATFPFRDTEGQPIPDGRNIAASYPWVDRAGKNVFMTGVIEPLLETVDNRFPHRCAEPTCDPTLPTEPSLVRGHIVAGLWTHGKMVHIDNLLNNTDWPIRAQRNQHMMVTLYDDAAGNPVEVRVGAGRLVGGHESASLPPGWSGNTNVQDSIENLFNFHAYMKPVTPRDIVWILSNGRATDEFPFDDYNNPNAFVVSEMIAGFSWHDEGPLTYTMFYRNGYNPLPPSYSGHVHLQNAATTLPDRWIPPKFGFVEAGTGRAEPVALGGIRGRGFWLTGTNRIDYEVVAQPRDIRAHDWYAGIFVDARFADDGAVRNLVAFPDGSALKLRGRGAVLFVDGGGATVHETALAEPIPQAGWTHLAVQMTNGNRDAVFYVDGFAFDSFSAAAALFEMTPGHLVVGATTRESGDGVRGWVDDFKVFAEPVTLEVACNLAHGTLIGVDDHAAWSAVASTYPAWAHGNVTLALEAAGEGSHAEYACFHDYASDWGAHLGNIPAGTVGLRRALNFPESPLVFGRPRPDSTANAFCVSCHVPGAPAGLSTAALALDPGTNVEDDLRRQPSQPLPLVLGHVPAGWIAPDAESGAPGGPDAATQAPDAGLSVDSWVLPHE